jgi:hypothetical protein
VGAHLDAEQFVDLLVLGGQEDHRHVGFLAQAAQRLHPVHARHLDVEDPEIGRVGLESVKRGGPVRVGYDAIALGREHEREGSQNVACAMRDRPMARARRP